MSLGTYKINIMRKVAIVANRAIEKDGDLLDLGYVFSGMDWDQVDTVTTHIVLEQILTKNLNTADDLLNEVGTAFASFHEDAADAIMMEPSEERVQKFKEALRELHEAKKNDGAFEATAMLAGEIATLIENA